MQTIPDTRKRERISKTYRVDGMNADFYMAAGK